MTNAALFRDHTLPIHPIVWLEDFTKIDGKPTQLYTAQKNYLADPHRFRAANKPRQIGFSKLTAGEALCFALQCPRETSIFVSTSLRDSKEKIRYAKEFFDTLPEAMKLKKIVDNDLEIEFENGSRIIALPASSSIRGKKANIYISEMAHIQNSHRLLTSVMGHTTRGGGLTIESTPLGEQGAFWEIMTQPTKYPAFSRHSYTYEDIEDTYIQSSIQIIKDTLDAESFAQEYEGQFLGDSQSYFPYELLLSCVYDDGEAWEVPTYGGLTGQITAGYDVGRRKDTSELIAGEHVEDVFYQRMGKSFSKMPFAAQEAELDELMANEAVMRLCIDETGLGMQLAESAQTKHGTRVEPINFASKVENMALGRKQPIKEMLAVTTRTRFEKQRIRIANDRGLLTQIHSIRRLVGKTGAMRFDPESNEEHHADKFWALALALHAGSTPQAMGPMVSF